jgi:hypothetical protein
VPKIVVPVGRSNGPEYPVDGGHEIEHYELVLGEKSIYLPAEAHETWALAFSDSEAHQQHRFTREHLAGLAAERGVADSATIVDRLVRSDAFAEYEPGADSALEFLQRHQLYPTASGMGNSPEDPSMYRIGRNGQVLALIEHDIFAFWSDSYRRGSMWVGVVAFDKKRPADAMFSTEQLGHLFAATVPVLVAVGVGVLEPL